MRALLTSAVLAAALALTACAGSVPERSAPPADRNPDRIPPQIPDNAEAVSLFGHPLAAPPLPFEVQSDREVKLVQAQAAARARPDDPDALIWLGRRIAYLGRYREAIDVFTGGVEKFPEDPRFLRHRGHRYISIRRFDLAEADLEKAAGLIAGKPDEVEPDGLPNAAGIPTSTLQSNIWYHLGLARYLQGDFAGALDAYRECLEVSKNPDMEVATRHWLYTTLRRLGRGAQDSETAEVLAPVRMNMEILENQGYHKLLLMYRGEIPPEALLPAAGGESGGESGMAEVDPVTAYGVGAWYLAEGRRDEAVRIFRRIVQSGQWAAFGSIAAEADLHRLGEGFREKIPG